MFAFVRRERKYKESVIRFQFDFDTIYNLPIWLRRFTFQNISEFYEKEKAEMEKASGKSKITNDSPKGPAIKQADYSTPARK